MIFDISISFRKYKQIFIEAENYKEAEEIAYSVADEKESDWAFDGDWTSEDLDITDPLEFEDIAEARAYYSNGENIPLFDSTGEEITQ